MLTKQDIDMYLAIERITFANREAYRVMSENMEEFVGNPTNEVYEQISSVMAQMCKLFKMLKDWQKVMVGALSETQRGSGGFGSTGE